MSKKDNNSKKKEVVKKHNRALSKQHLSIKKFHVKEIETYLSIIQESFETVAEDLQLTKGIFPASGAFFDKNAFDKILNNGAELFGLYHKDITEMQLVGCVAINSKDGRKYKIMKLAILPVHRQKGYGGLLMDFVEDYILTLGGQAISLGMVSENNVLKQWYLGRNYKVTKTSPYKKTNYNICFMEKKIKNTFEEVSIEQGTCKECELPVAECKCSETLNITTDIQIWLLTHENESTRPTNTGQLIKDALPDNTEIFYWSRVSPPEELLSLLKDEAYYPILVFPVENDNSTRLTAESLNDTLLLDMGHKKAAFLILDGTWKEARKILRKSDYLADLPFLPLENLEKTRYTLRRNKDIDHICTIEVAIELFKLSGEEELANGLNRIFELFLKAYKR